ncbi:MAG TPA: hypothetical protein VI451_09040, partial [Anaerolineales bacterium]|nr:hypothetical protein [Anaerolineales bacterium]
GCAGCSGSCGTRSHASQPVFSPTWSPTAGFIPVEGLTSNVRRGQGQMPTFIPIGEIGEYLTPGT